MEIRPFMKNRLLQIVPSATDASTAETVRLRGRDVSYDEEGVKNQEFRVPRVEMTSNEISLSSGESPNCDRFRLIVTDCD